MESQAEAAPVNVEEAASIIADKMSAVDEPKKEEEKTETSEIVSEEKPEEVQPETDTTESSETEEISEDSEKESKSETEEPEEEAQETFESIADLAEATGMELKDFLDTVKQTVKINGEEMQVSLSDLTAGYQMESDYRRKTTELSEQRKTFEVEKEQAATQAQAKFQEVEQLATNLEQQLMGEYNNIDWNQLEIQDREEWLVQRQKFGERHQQLEGIKSKIQGEQQQRQEQLQARHNDEYQAHLVKENEALLLAIPSWSDEAVRSEEVTAMTSHLKTYGFSDEEASQISDHRIMRMIRDSYMSANRNQKVDVVKKKVKTLPKIVKPSAKTNKQASKQRASNDTWAIYLKSGKQADLTAHMAAKL